MSSAALLIAEDEPKAIIIVEEVGFESDGRTRQGALAREVKLEAGTEFESMSKLRDRLDREVQDLLNLRVFAEVTVRVEDLPSGVGVPRKVRVVFTVHCSLIRRINYLIHSRRGGQELSGNPYRIPHIRGHQYRHRSRRRIA